MNNSQEPTPWMSPRIWRHPDAHFDGDEPLEELEVYTPERLRAIRAHGFDAIWLRGRLGELVENPIFPQLKNPLASQRMENLRQLIERGRTEGIEVYIFFNEPLALLDNHFFWDEYPELKGQPHFDRVRNRQLSALCTSTAPVIEYMSDGIRQIIRGLHNLGGVILITATENFSHCWSHYFRYDLNDGYTTPSEKPMQCPRCREREPASIVTELIGLWQSAAAEFSPAPKVIAWNWSWSIWYPDPQPEVIDNLPNGIALMSDWERGGTMDWRGQTISVDEYSMSYTGPSERFARSQEMAKKRGLPMNAKLQIGTTHEIATVPNLPLISNLHGKFRGLYERNVAGAMATWNFGCSLTLNSFAFGLFGRDPQKYSDQTRFFEDLIHEYFGDVDVQSLSQAWQKFAEAFANYPFSIGFLYGGPLNYAPALPLSLHYEAKPLGPSWIIHEPGERLEDCLGEFSLQQYIDSFADMTDAWAQGNALYQAALNQTTSAVATARHRFEEASCASMIECQLRSFLHVARFHQWRLRRISEQKLTPPCTLAPDDEARAIWLAERVNAVAALQLTERDARLGYHQEGKGYFYNPKMLRQKIAELDANLAELA